MNGNFKKELAAYAAKLSELQQHSGKFVLIKEDKIEGVFDSYADALKFGYDRFKLEPFLVKQIAPSERVLFFTRELSSACL